MPERKQNVINQILNAFQKKKTACDDIVTAAEKVVESYIVRKNRLIQKACNTQKKNGTLGAVFIILIACGLIAALLAAI